MTFLIEEISQTQFVTTGVPPASFDATEKHIGQSSIKFSETATSTWLGSYGNPIRMNAPAGTNLFGLSNFTISFWMYLNADPLNTTVTIIDQHKSDGMPSWYIRVYSDRLWFVVGTSAFLFASSGYISGYGWSHVAVVKASNVYKLYINGVCRHTVTTSADYSGTMGYFSIGDGKDHGGTPHPFNGYIDELFITNTAMWTADFTPPVDKIIVPGPEVLFLVHFDELTYKISGTTTDNCRIYVFNEDTEGLESSKSVLAGNYEVDVSIGTKTIVAIPESSDKNGEVYRGVTPIEI